jgi:hypothetical protein
MKSIFLISVLFVSIAGLSREGLKTINLKETTRIETTLAADSMGGRRAYTQGNEKAAAFIAN